MATDDTTDVVRRGRGHRRGRRRAPKRRPCTRSRSGSPSRVALAGPEPEQQVRRDRAQQVPGGVCLEQRRGVAQAVLAGVPDHERDQHDGHGGDAVPHVRAGRAAPPQQQLDRHRGHQQDAERDVAGEQHDRELAVVEPHQLAARHQQQEELGERRHALVHPPDDGVRRGERRHEVHAELVDVAAELRPGWRASPRCPARAAPRRRRTPSAGRGSGGARRRGSTAGRPGTRSPGPPPRSRCWTGSSPAGAPGAVAGRLAEPVAAPHVRTRASPRRARAPGGRSTRPRPPTRRRAGGGTGRAPANARAIPGVRNAGARDLVRERAVVVLRTTLARVGQLLLPAAKLVEALARVRVTRLTSTGAERRPATRPSPSRRARPACASPCPRPCAPARTPPARCRRAVRRR